MNDAVSQVRTLYVSNLHYKIDEKDLIGIFRKFGRIDHVFIPLKENGTHKKGIAFILMGNAEAAQKAAKSVNETIIDDRTVKVVVAREDRFFGNKDAVHKKVKKEDEVPMPKKRRERVTSFETFLKNKQK